ncbi:universal stress protein [Geodermatophilus marinus]|uniref:universal stress protein n=1 Tax=Geodermatophilus sp. LHW52908 TaxID=2303986 RepID=UPI000E3C4339|nr:universal stress protein [Geodermatophilus sp. LHW52908]RFU19021.1 universal stress protein [Geodermatophilus sp. LHW52908]
MPSTIVLVNDRPEGDTALRWATDHARRRGTALHVVLARADSPAAPEYGSPSLRARIATRLLDGGLPHRLHDPEEDVADQVDRLATAAGADLVVVPVRRRSPALKLVLGSFAQRIILDAPCPVVTVKSPDR